MDFSSLAPPRMNADMNGAGRDTSDEHSWMDDGESVSRSVVENFVAMSNPAKVNEAVLRTIFHGGRVRDTTPDTPIPAESLTAAVGIEVARQRQSQSQAHAQKQNYSQSKNNVAAAATSPPPPQLQSQWVDAAALVNNSGGMLVAQTPYRDAAAPNTAHTARFTPGGADDASTVVMRNRNSVDDFMEAKYAAAEIAAAEEEIRNRLNARASDTPAPSTPAAQRTPLPMPMEQFNRGPSPSPSPSPSIAPMSDRIPRASPTAPTFAAPQYQSPSPPQQYPSQTPPQTGILQGHVEAQSPMVHLNPYTTTATTHAAVPQSPLRQPVSSPQRGVEVPFVSDARFETQSPPQARLQARFETHNQNQSPRQTQEQGQTRTQTQTQTQSETETYARVQRPVQSQPQQTRPQPARVQVEPQQSQPREHVQGQTRQQGPPPPPPHTTQNQKASFATFPNPPTRSTKQQPSDHGARNMYEAEDEYDYHHPPQGGEMPDARENQHSGGSRGGGGGVYNGSGRNGGRTTTGMFTAATLAMEENRNPETRADKQAIIQNLTLLSTPQNGVEPLWARPLSMVISDSMTLEELMYTESTVTAQIRTNAYLESAHTAAPLVCTAIVAFSNRLGVHALDGLGEGVANKLPSLRSETRQIIKQWWCRLGPANPWSSIGWTLMMVVAATVVKNVTKSGDSPVSQALREVGQVFAAGVGVNNTAPQSASVTAATDPAKPAAATGGRTLARTRQPLRGSRGVAPTPSATDAPVPTPVAVPVSVPAPVVPVASPAVAQFDAQQTEARLTSMTQVAMQQLQQAAALNAQRMAEQMTQMQQSMHAQMHAQMEAQTRAFAQAHEEGLKAAARNQALWQQQMQQQMQMLTLATAHAQAQAQASGSGSVLSQPHIQPQAQGVRIPVASVGQSYEQSHGHYVRGHDHGHGHGHGHARSQSHGTNHVKVSETSTLVSTEPTHVAEEETLISRIPEPLEEVVVVTHTTTAAAAAEPMPEPQAESVDVVEAEVEAEAEVAEEVVTPPLSPSKLVMSAASTVTDTGSQDLGPELAAIQARLMSRRTPTPHEPATKTLRRRVEREAAEAGEASGSHVENTTAGTAVNRTARSKRGGLLIL